MSSLSRWPDPAELPRRRWSRRRRRTIGSAAVAIAVLAGVTGFLAIQDNRYGPIRPGSFGGILTPSSFAYEQDGTYRLTAASGQLMESMDNRGSHSITITSMTSAQNVTAVQWSVFTFEPGRSVTGEDAEWQSFPATIPAHGTIRLRVTVQRPKECPATGNQNRAPQNSATAATTGGTSCAGTRWCEVGRARSTLWPSRLASVSKVVLDRRGDPPVSSSLASSGCDLGRSRVFGL